MIRKNLLFSAVSASLLIVLSAKSAVASPSAGVLRSAAAPRQALELEDLSKNNQAQLVPTARARDNPTRAHFKSVAVVASVNVIINTLRPDDGISWQVSHAGPKITLAGRLIGAKEKARTRQKAGRKTRPASQIFLGTAVDGDGASAVPLLTQSTLYSFHSFGCSLIDSRRCACRGYFGNYPS